jgi:hypothetical protein
MLSNETKKALRAQLESFGGQVKRLGIDHRDEARALFKSLKLDGAIKAITPLEFKSEDILELAAHKFREYEPVFAVDGGSTRPKVLENGTTICAMQAVLCGNDEQELLGLPLEAYRSLAFVSHSRRLDLGGADAELFNVNEFSHLWRIHVPRTYLEHEVERVVGGIARAAAESYHTLRMLNALEIDSSFFILDGNLYPIGLYYYFAGGRPNGHFEKKNNWYEWAPAVEILAQPVRVVEAFAEHGLAFAALNKNPGTSWLLEFTLKPEDQNWSSDAQFVKAVLSQTKKDRLGYTNWFVQEEYSLPQRTSEEGPATFDLFEKLRAFGLKRPARDYHTCFFYVYDPRVLSVLKVEVPRIILEQHDPDKLQGKFLSEIARGKGVPPAIRRADSRARITEEEAAALIKACGVELDYHYDHSRGESI